ncbi:MAG: hypothetical protein KDB99_10655 [Chitinophagaceae bacterium]|nr:hypothetical protein [Chitinophagaceae bacterium]MCB9054688.1 hypothetical protein [Chitinophagales bacterium]
MKGIKYIHRRVFQLFLLIIVAKDIYAQNISVSERFNKYTSRVIQEKLFVHTDKDFYTAGEILWFKIYYVNGATHQSLQLSKIAYVEVLNENNEPVLEGKISLEPGESNGSFYLPVTLSTGNYTLRAYTNWMKNFDNEYFFQKKLTIVNTIKSPGEDNNKDSSVINVDFFPEGGNLVNDIQSRVGFIIRDARGGINDCNGYILNDRNDTITSFMPLKFGIGSFYFKPTVGIFYKATIVLPSGLTINKDLPQAFDYGYTIQVADKNDKQVAVAVKRKKMPGEHDVTQVLLVAHTRQVLKLAEKKTINDNDSIVFLVDKTKLDKGISHFILFNNNDKPVCERLIFIEPEKPSVLNVKCDKDKYTNREKIEIALNMDNPADTPDDLSAAVFYIDSLQEEESDNIYNYMWLTSDLNGYIETPGYYFSNLSIVKTATDNLMLVHGWSRFRWDDIVKGDESFIKYLPEIDGMLVNGKAFNSRTGELAKGMDTYLSIPGNPFGFYTSRSDQNGLVRYNVKDYFGNGQIIAQRGIETDSFYSVSLFKPFAEPPATNKFGHYSFNEENRKQLIKRSIGMQVQNVYASDSIRVFEKPEVRNPLPFYGYPDASYRLDDYKRFTTMEEVLREYVFEIGVTMRNGNLGLKIFNPEANDFHANHELVLLDGVPLLHFNRIFSYDPLKVKKLDVVVSRYVLGKSLFNGIASFTTNNAVFDGFELDPTLVAVDYAGIQLQRQFYSPVYDTPRKAESRMPDFRTTLMWNPNIKLNSETKNTLEFYSSDLSGKYMIIVQGTDGKGNFYFGTDTFDVQ